MLRRIPYKEHTPTGQPSPRDTYRFEKQTNLEKLRRYYHGKEFPSSKLKDNEIDETLSSLNSEVIPPNWIKFPEAYTEICRTDSVTTQLRMKNKFQRDFFHNIPCCRFFPGRVGAVPFAPFPPLNMYREEHTMEVIPQDSIDVFDPEIEPCPDHVPNDRSNELEDPGSEISLDGPPVPGTEEDWHRVTVMVVIGNIRDSHKLFVWNHQQHRSELSFATKLLVVQTPLYVYVTGEDNKPLPDDCPVHPKSGYFNLIGGCPNVKADGVTETPMETALREFEEETGIVADEADMHPLSDFYDNSDNRHFVYFMSEHQLSKLKPQTDDVAGYVMFERGQTRRALREYGQSTDGDRVRFMTHALFSWVMNGTPHKFKKGRSAVTGRRVIGGRLY